MGRRRTSAKRIALGSKSALLSTSRRVTRQEASSRSHLHKSKSASSKTEISDHATDLNTDRALKEILDDGTEVPVIDLAKELKESKSQQLTMSEFKPNEDLQIAQESSNAG